MKEHEVKILEINEEEVIKKLESLNAKKDYDEIIESEYYDFKDGSLKNSSKMLRLREIAGKNFITFKNYGEKENILMNYEHESEVSDINAVRNILNHLGLASFSSEKRRRVSFILHDARIDINKHNNIPAYIEVETESPEKLKQIVSLLGFSMNDTKTWTGGEVLDYYKRRKEN